LTTNPSGGGGSDGGGGTGGSHKLDYDDRGYKYNMDRLTMDGQSITPHASPGASMPSGGLPYTPSRGGRSINGGDYSD